MDYLNPFVVQLVQDVAALKEGRKADRAQMRLLRQRMSRVQIELDKLTNAPTSDAEFSPEVMRAYHAATRDLTPQTKRIVLGKLRTLKADGMDDRHLMASLADGEEPPPLSDL